MRLIWLHRVTLRAFAEVTNYGRYWRYIVGRLETDALRKIALEGTEDTPPDKLCQKWT
jgi:hypothetical protein